MSQIGMVDMLGNKLKGNRSFNVPSYDLATGQYINQPNSQVQCYNRTSKAGKKYTTCENTEYGFQLRKGQPPKKKNKDKKVKKKVKNTTLIKKKSSLNDLRSNIPREFLGFHMSRPPTYDFTTKKWKDMKKYFPPR